MEKTTVKRNEELKKLLEGTQLEGLDYADFENSEELIENMRTQISEEEVIYYGVAMDYLMANDDSLKDSIAIALECGYELKNVNSELLATLLKQNLMNEELSNIESEIESIYEESN